VIKKRIQSGVKKVKDAIKSVQIDSKYLYDYSTDENAKNTALYLYEYSKTQRSQQETMWQLYNDYYNGEHQTALMLKAHLESQGIPFIPASVQDPFTHVESQIVPDIPDFEFNGRDDDLDSQKAKQREYAVQYVLDRNQVNGKNPRNERRLGKYGNAFWKVYWDSDIQVPGTVLGGDIVVIDVGVENIFPDPTATSVEDCEFINYAYPMHIRAAQRKWSKELKKLGIQLSAMGSTFDTDIFNSDTQDTFDDTVQVVEHWYRDDDGDISCVILINDEFVKHIKKYWLKTGKQNKNFPFVKYCKIEDENNFWDVSEMRNILELVDAADRELAYGILNTAMSANDIILYEENAFAEGSGMSNEPGAMIGMKDGCINSVRRLGGLTSVVNHVASIQFLQAQIERTVGNYDTSMGVEPTRVTTASGIAQINERADARKNIKKADRTYGFEKLYQLIDWTCLEFYDEERMIYIGVENKELNKKFVESGMLENLDKEQGPIIFTYSSNKMSSYDKANESYYPVVDCTVIASDSLSKSKAFSVQAIQDLVRTTITQDNYKLIMAYIDLLNLPDRKDIKRFLTERFEQPEKQEEMSGDLTEEELQELINNPQLIPGGIPNATGM